jgi:hypothetical protein
MDFLSLNLLIQNFKLLYFLKVPHQNSELVSESATSETAELATRMPPF